MRIERLKGKLQYLLPHHFFSRCVAKLAECKAPFVKNLLIKLFISVYKIDLNTAAEKKITYYHSFNEFFTRALQPDIRPIVSGENELASPADGIVSQAGRIEEGKLFQAKGHFFKLINLLGGDQACARAFQSGSFITIYLSPKDYHRVHMPIEGTLLKTIYVPGQLFSVNKTSVATIPNLFCKNERLICLFETQVGMVAVILVGAMLVAGIETVWGQRETPSRQKKIIYKDYHDRKLHLNKGSEMGLFKFGSTVMVLFPPNQVCLQQFTSHQDILMGSLIGHVTREGG